MHLPHTPLLQAEIPERVSTVGFFSSTVGSKAAHELVQYVEESLQQYLQTLQHLKHEDINSSTVSTARWILTTTVCCK